MTRCGGLGTATPYSGRCFHVRADTSACGLRWVVRARKCSWLARVRRIRVGLGNDEWSKMSDYRPS